MQRTMSTKSKSVSPIRHLFALGLTLLASLALFHATAGENPSLFPTRTGTNVEIATDFTVDAAFSSHLPLLVVELPSGGSAPDASARLSVYDNSDGRNALTDVPAVTLDVLVRELPDRPDGDSGGHAITLASSGSAPSRIALAGLPEDSQWLLRRSPRDKSMLRNGLAYCMGQTLFPDATPKFKYCEVLYKNNGRFRYEGIFLLAERDERVFASLPDRGSGTSILRFSPGQERRGELVVRAGNKIFSAVQSGADDEARQEARKRAGVDLAKLEGALLAVQPTTFLRYESMLDEDSVINLYILNMLMLNAGDDPVSFHLYSDTDGRFRCIPDWSFDEAMDNRPVREHPLSFEEDFQKIQPPSVLSRRVPVWRTLESGGDIRDLRLYPLYTAMSGENFLWFDRLFLSRSFLTRLYDRYHQVRRGTLAPEAIRATLYDLATNLGPAIERDWIRWHNEYAAAESPYALQPFVDADGEEHVRQTWSFDQELVKIGHCLRRQDGFLRDQLERLDWMTADLYDKGTSGNRQAAYAFLALIAMMTLMHLLSKKL